MKNWRVKLTAGGKGLAEVKIERVIFQEDALSPLCFVIATMPLNPILRKYIGIYKIHKSQEKIKHLNDMDVIKLFAKNEKRIRNPNINSEDIVRIEGWYLA